MSISQLILIEIQNNGFATKIAERSEACMGGFLTLSRSLLQSLFTEFGW